MNEPLRTFTYTSRSPHITGPNDTETTNLFAALVALRTAWRADHETFSVAVMIAFGALIAETEAVIDFAEGE